MGNIPLVDMHCHLDLLASPSTEVKECINSTIHTIAVTNVPSVFPYTFQLVKDSPFASASLGLHPELITSHGKEIELFPTHLAQTRYIGEVGLDYVTQEADSRAKQKTMFERILELCSPFGNKILSIHSRRAGRDVLAAVGDAYPGKVVLHWFSDPPSTLSRAVAIGCYFSVNLAMCNSKAGRLLLEAMPQERVLTETDAPFIGGPSVRRGAQIRQVLQELSRIWSVSVEEAGAIVFGTYRSL